MSIGLVPRTGTPKVATGGLPRRCAVSPAPLGLALAAAVILLGGCERDDDSAGPETPPIEYRRFVAVEVASLPDSLAAQRLRDSLETVGWVAYVRSDDPSGWSVRVAPTQNLAWAEVAAAGIGTPAEVIQDSGTVMPQGVAGFTRVNYESPGMFTRLRWVRSPEADAILVMEDAASTENDPAPNGFVFASEELRQMMQMDSVWDAAPAPDWHRVGFGRAYVLRAGEAENPPPAMWEELADTLGIPAATLRQAAFPASGMAIMFGLAQPGVAVLEAQSDSAADANGSQVRMFPVLAGWRVAWNADGSELYAGTAPAAVQDDSPPAGWVALDPMRSGEPRQVEPPSGVQWVDGPTIDISVALDTGRRIAIGLPEADSLVSQNGWIRLGGKIVGPGVALTATRTGRYVVALAPNPSAEEYEPGYMAVVYVVGEEGRESY